MKNKHLRNLGIIFVVSIVITFTFDLLSGGNLKNINSVILNIFYGILIGGSLSLTGEVTHFVLKKSDISLKPVKTYVVLLVSVTLFITIDVFAINTLWYHFTQGAGLTEMYSNTAFVISSVLTIFIGLIIFFIILSKSYISRLNMMNIELSEIKHEADKAKFETLKAQINPHFLFNSLNTLSSLIYTDTTKADEFIHKLSEIYRYILEYQDEELIELDKELDFAEKYLYLQQIRFNNQFEINITKDDKYSNMFIVPLSLQILLENVFKHNVISNKNKLKINIYFENDYLVVENNIIQKADNIISHKIGLQNIENRYKLITGKNCIQQKTSNMFKVKLPLILNNDENTYSRR